uniref:Thioredoxin domain-containing protein n=1 Tax=Pinguiococcus pyrenoidosus TaxID=172671 RepID=A0A7R9U0I5_9STRA|mmetsp:Transcript_10226/g.38758  ORF Transcript_10226/g.38758 Transcript_10226/m.38758 type:complete len:153 (+) Transcript_10226:92-550(+)
MVSSRAVLALLALCAPWQSSGFVVRRLPSRPAALSRAPALRMAVVEIGDTDKFDKALSAAGDAVVVVDYSTTWCGPCKVIAPFFAELSEKHQDTVFLKVIGDSSAEATKLMKREGVRSVPAFHFWKGGEKVDIVSGANPDALEGALLKQLEP